MEGIRQKADQMSHQQDDTPNGGRYGLAGTGSNYPNPHSTATGAAVSGFASKFGHGGDKNFSAQHTVDPSETYQDVPQTENHGVTGVGSAPQAYYSTDSGLHVICGPLLNYKRMGNPNSDQPIWHGSVLLVTQPDTTQPHLDLRCLGPVGGGSNGYSNGTSYGGSQQFKGVKLYEDPKSCFWRFRVELPFQAFEAAWEYTIPNLMDKDGKRSERLGRKIFHVPSKNQSMRILFHSCNGFSVGTDVDAWSGPALWNDVNRFHEQKPFHVMIGGGDQIYNDGVRVNGPLRPWTDIGNPKKRREFPFNEELRAKCDQYYFDNYIRWYGQEPFATANGQIAQLNIWDDHDIIDGFGSYTDNFMRCAVFRGIGGVAHKYYLLFQQHIPPPKSTFTTDAPKTMQSQGIEGAGADPVQLHDTFVMTGEPEESNYIIGPKPGPYVEERSRSILCQLGRSMMFLGIDARTERTRHQINYPETYELIFSTLQHELEAAQGTVKHLILLLGVPIAYPRLQWLENILSSPIIGPIRFFNKRFGLAGGFFNHFDGKVDLLDDLDDHYTAHQHKHERRELIQRLQVIAKKHSVRVTILGGDVHLAALGRFYSNPDQGIPAEKDWRYMTNIISSAITNKPPPQAVANLLARRNKIHHLDHETDETLLNLFNHDPGMGKGSAKAEAKEAGIKPKSGDSNHCTMPSRNYAIIAEAALPESSMPDGTLNPHHTPATNGGTNGSAQAPSITGNGSVNGSVRSKKDNPRNALHVGEVNAGTEHPFAQGLRPTGLAGPDALDVCIRVEIDPADRNGHTEGYGLSIPALDSRGYMNQGVTW